MSYDSPDPYHQPEEFGLRQVASLSDPDACWSFGLLVVWEDQAGEFFWASDSGCSCPSPFEDYHSIDQLTKLTPDSLPAFLRAVEQFYDYSEWDPTTKVDFLRNVREAMR